MSQIRYLVYAVLLLAVLSVAVFIVGKLSLVEIIAKKPTVIDYVDKPAVATVSINAEGKKLFEDNCHTCHSLHKSDNFNFESIETRGPWVDRKNLIAWIKDPAVMTPKFQYTKDLVTQFNGQMMPSFSHLTDAQNRSHFRLHQKLPAVFDGNTNGDKMTFPSFTSANKTIRHFHTVTCRTMYRRLLRRHDK